MNAEAILREIIREVTRTVLEEKVKNDVLGAMAPTPAPAPAPAPEMQKSRPENLRLFPVEPTGGPLTVAVALSITRLGQLVELLREHRGENQTEFAEFFGCHRSNIARWESGDQSMTRKTVHRLAELLSLDPEVLEGIWKRERALERALEAAEGTNVRRHIAAAIS